MAAEVLQGSGGGRRRGGVVARFAAPGPTSREGREVHRSFLRGGGVARRPGRQRVRTRRIHELAAG